MDSIELYSARQRSHYVAMAAVELGLEERIVKREIGEILLRLEQAHDEALTAATRTDKAERTKLTADEEKAALDLLRDPRLLDRILADLERCGVIGEGDNKLVGYLAATSRKLRRPLAVLIQSSSSSGKSSLMEAVLGFVPEEDRLSFSALTGQSLFYLGDSDLRHKVLSIAEEEGAARASYALKVLQSEGRLTIASTGKDATTGRLVSQRYTAEGPVAIFTTTTALDVDERPEHTKAIHIRQRRTQTLDGLFDREEHAAIVQLHRNAQRLLAPVAVVNPFAADLTFADHRVRARRDHQKYLGLIEALAYQRHLFYLRKPNGKPLTFASQARALTPVRGFFKWLTRQNVLLSNPASEIELPKQERRLPRHVLTIDEAERVMEQPDVREPLGVRDRAILEALYSTGIRRMEVVNLQLYDLDAERGTLHVREGKGKRDRVVPIGERAVMWVNKYVHEVRQQLIMPPDEGVLFLTQAGEALSSIWLTQVIRRYIGRAEIGKTGSCHLWRHTCATLMLEGGADVRYVQEMLGHAKLSTTAIYTQVSIRQLKSVHTLTHPAAKLDRATTTETRTEPSPTESVIDLHAVLDAEAAEEADATEPG